MFAYPTCELQSNLIVVIVSSDHPHRLGLGKIMFPMWPISEVIFNHKHMKCEEIIL